MAGALGPRCTAVAAILDAGETAEMEILVNADGDAAGDAIAARALKRAGAQPWRSVDASAGIHEESWLTEQLNGASRVGFPWQSINAFLRISTHPRAFQRGLTPAPHGSASPTGSPRRSPGYRNQDPSTGVSSASSSRPTRYAAT